MSDVVFLDKSYALAGRSGRRNAVPPAAQCATENRGQSTEAALPGLTLLSIKAYRLAGQYFMFTMPLAKTWGEHGEYVRPMGRGCMIRGFWTHERDQELARRYIAGEPPEEIAATLGCTMQALRTRCSTLGIVRRKLRSDKPVHGNADFVLGKPLSESGSETDADGG